MDVNDLVIVTESYEYDVYYIEPERGKRTKIIDGTIGIIVENKKGFVWVISYGGAFQAQKKHLRVIGKSSPKEFYGYDTVEWNKIVGDDDGIWLDKGLMHLGERKQQNV